MFQSTPPHGGRRQFDKKLIFCDVSIHAPAWRATQGQTSSSPSRLFQSTPPHGGRHKKNFERIQRLCFNPRPRMEGDAFNLLIVPDDIVSIHAPAWRATVASFDIVTKSMFQSTPPHGGRPFNIYNSKLKYCVSIHAPAWRATHRKIGNPP